MHRPMGLGHKELHHYIEDKLPTWHKHTLGKSYRGKKIFSYSLGSDTGKKVLMWSQMHGNEPFSTYALVLAMEFLQTDHELSRLVRESLNIIAIPMLNPDGSQNFTRRNAQGININRDALRRTSPEAQILAKTFENFAPYYCFNLHDQEIYYAPQGEDRPTAMAFLVPSSDIRKTVTQARMEAMDILGYVARELNDYPLAKYNDSFMPTAFGDYFSSQGAATMLFETGYIIGDQLRRETSLLHALSILLALRHIAQSNGREYINVYEQLPFNQKHAFFDFIMKNVILKNGKQSYRVDLAINRNRLDPDRFVSFDEEYLVFDIGDLTGKQAFRVKDFEGKLILPKEKIFMYAQADWLLPYFD